MRSILFHAFSVALVVLHGGVRADTPGTLEKIKSSGTITLAYRESSIPFSYLDDKAQPTGFGHEICLKVVDAAKKATGRPDLKVNLQAVASANRIPLLQNGTIDIERKLGLELLAAKDHAESALMVKSGRALAFGMDDILLYGLRANSPHPAALAIVGDPIQVEPYAIMLRKNDPAFKKLVDETLAGLMASGEFTKLYTKWFLSPIPPKGIMLNAPMSKELSDNLKALSDKPAV